MSEASDNERKSTARSGRSSGHIRGSRTRVRGANIRRKKKTCPFCHDRVLGALDYKAVDRLKRFLTDRGKIVPQRVAGTCAKHQRRLTVLIKRARMMALLPYVGSFQREGRERS
ncbi:MAG: 30S ribosomal protein S18 [Candidatus Hydrogenedentota bacterium]|nr:MAG: 30S ribosomal protein S18 [Candidatus Hydrogenedentota bacterium]